MTHHSEPAREAVARAIYEAFGYAYSGRTIGASGPYSAWATACKAADSVLALSASPAPAAGGLEAVRAMKPVAWQYESPQFGVSNVQWVTMQDGHEYWTTKKVTGRPVKSIRGLVPLDDVLAALASPAATSAETQGDGHSDDLAVDRFAAAMKAKLAKKRAEGRGGWEDKEDCPNGFLSYLLREHVDKGDPVDVGNLAMMIHQRGERIGR